MTTLAEWILRGGDTRLDLDPATHANKYGCTPLPDPQLQSFSSCTARSISDSALQAVQLACADRNPEMPADQSNLKMDALRAELSQMLGLDAIGAEIILAASGTDVTLFALFLARRHDTTPLDNIVLAPDETGRGIPNVTAGLHFDSKTARGVTVSKDQPIPGFSDMTFLPVQVRDPDGNRRSDAAIDEEVITRVDHSVRSGRRVVLHVLECSKLGEVYPSATCLETLQLRHGAAVQILVDACQGRISRERLHWHLRLGRLVSITGSKFFTGPPFSGALLVPKTLADDAATVTRVPEGLRDYTEASAWPSGWTGIRTALPEGLNPGLYARWVAGLSEMRNYFAIPAASRQKTLQDWANHIYPLLADCPYLQLLPLQAPASDQAPEPGWGGLTLFPFLVRYPQTGFLSFADSTALYRALQQDLSGYLQMTAATSDEASLAKQRFQLGQPVRIGDLGALRLCTDARMVYQHWKAAEHDRDDNDIRYIPAVLQKIALILRNPDLLSRFQ